MEGECLCKKVKVKVNDDNLFGQQRRGHICHCANCRKVAGGIFGVNLIIENEKVEFPLGQDNIKRYDVSMVNRGGSSGRLINGVGPGDAQRNTCATILLQRLRGVRVAPYDRCP